MPAQEDSGQPFSAVTGECLPWDLAVRQAAWCKDWSDIEISHGPRPEPSLASQVLAHRAASLSIDALIGLTPSTTLAVLVEIEDLLRNASSAETVLARLCRAPLRDSKRARRLADAASEHNHRRAAALFQRLFDLQPLLGRLVHAWLALPEGLFSAVRTSRQDLWCTLVDDKLILHLARTTSQAEFSALWITIALSSVSPQARPGVFRIANELSASLFPESVGASQYTLVAEPEPERYGIAVSGTEHLSGTQKQARALKEIAAISAAVATGQDDRAIRFLKQLVTWQLETDDDRQYAIKSLCHLAKRCADSFRMDFERRCLQYALEVDPADPWLLVQWGDHLKRTGQLDDAIENVDRAVGTSQDVVARSLIADIHRTKGQLDRAEEIYLHIPDWQDHPTVVTALADIWRLRSDYRRATDQYNDVIARWAGAHGARAAIGLAEIDKTQGDFDAAIRRHDQLLGSPDLTGKDRDIVSYNRCDVLALAGQLDEALLELDLLLAARPFMAAARRKRAVLLGIRNRPDEAFRDLASPVFTERQAWDDSLARGLILMKLSRLDEAITELREFAPHPIASDTAPRTGRVLWLPLALAHAELHPERSEKGELGRRESYIPETNDFYGSLVSDVLRTHYAARTNNRKALRTLAKRAKVRGRGVSGFVTVVKRIKAGDYREAWSLGTDLLLRAA